MQLSGKTILVLSPQPWGNMRLSKHHYAETLAKLGNTVYFIGPPEKGISLAAPTVEPDPDSGVSVLKYRFFFPEILRFKAFALYRLFMRLVVARILRFTGKADLVWDFLNTPLFPEISMFRANAWIRHPVDHVPSGGESGAKPDLVLSVSPHILEPYRERGWPAYYLAHGLSAGFVPLAESRLKIPVYQPGQPVKVGYVGNVRFGKIDRELVLTLVEAHPEVEFHFFGTYLPEAGFGHPSDTAASDFVMKLQAQPQVKLHGSVKPAQLATHLEQLDVFLVAYALDNDPNQNANSHKIIEYLSTGRAVVSTHISAYAGTDLLVMPDTPGDNLTVPELFSDVVRNLETWNSVEKQQTRIAFALDNTYASHVRRVEGFLNAHKK